MENKFGRLLKHYREESELSQRELAEELKEIRNEPIDKSRISKWEHGQVPSKDMIEDLEEILRLKGELLKAAGYLIEGHIVDKTKPDDYLLLKLRQQHFEQLADIAVHLLANELGTVTTKKPTLQQGEAEPKEWSKFEYWIGQSEKRGLKDERLLSETLLQNWESLKKFYKESELDCLMAHVTTDFKTAVPDSLVDSEKVNKYLDVFEFLRVKIPYEMISRIRKVVDSFGFSGTCSKCKDWNKFR